MDLYLIRHTRVAIEPGICYGQSEIDLADSFDDECETLRRLLPDKFDCIYSSPLQRSAQLAVSLGAEPLLDPRLLECHFGEWEMQPWDDINGELLDEWMQDFVGRRPPGGETLVEMTARVGEFIDELREQSYRRVLVVTHAGVIRCVWALLLQVPLRHLFKLNVGYGAPLRIRLERDPDYDQLYTYAQR